MAPEDFVTKEDFRNLQRDFKELSDTVIVHIGVTNKVLEGVNRSLNNRGETCPLRHSIEEGQRAFMWIEEVKDKLTISTGKLIAMLIVAALAGGGLGNFVARFLGTIFDVPYP